MPQFEGCFETGRHSGLVVGWFGLEFLVLGNLADGLHEVLLEDVVAVGADGEEAAFGADVAQVGAVKAVREFADGLVVDLASLGDGPGVNLEDVQARLL